MKITKYYIEQEIDERKCAKCGTLIKVGEPSYEDDNNVKKPKTYCKDCIPKNAKITKGTQIYS